MSVLAHAAAESATDALGPQRSANPEVADADSIAAIVGRSGSSFYWAMMLLSNERRTAMFAIYAFCRAVDDVADEPGETVAKRAALAEWRREIGRLYEGTPQSIIGRELQAAVRRFGLRREDFLAVIDGVEMDVGEPIRAPSMAELDLYCARVASAAGHLSIRAFGTPPEAGQPVAESLGRALQLTNILRDLAEDAAIGRLYLPRELLVAHGIETRDPAAALTHPALPKVCSDLAALAEWHFARAANAMAKCPRATTRSARVMMKIYQQLLRRLVARGWTHLSEPVAVPKIMKLLIAARCALL
jgi:phytoene synthase